MIFDCSVGENEMSGILEGDLFSVSLVNGKNVLKTEFAEMYCSVFIFPQSCFVIFSGTVRRQRKKQGTFSI